MRLAIWLLLVAALPLAGCRSYTWRSQVPERMRTVAVPTFRNESDVTELGAVAAGQVAREFQREGTFALRRAGESAIEIQGVIEKAMSSGRAYRRNTDMRNNEFTFTAQAKVSVIDKVHSKVLIDNRVYRAETTYVANQDALTGERNASGRLAEDLARQIVDDVTEFDFTEEEKSDE